MSSPDAVHFSIENFDEDFNMLMIIPCSNILDLNFVHPEGHKTMCFEWTGRSWIFTLCENKSVRLTWNSPANNVGNQVQITLNIDIISRITNDYDILWRKLRSEWVELVGVKWRTCLFTNTLKMITRRITSLILFRRRSYLQFFTFWIFFNPTNYANLYLTIYSFILECLQYQNYGLRWNKRDLFTITA